MKKITSITTIIAVTVFSNLVVAGSGGYDQKEDILHGNGAVSASPYTPFVRTNTGPQGTETDLLSNLHEVEQSSGFIPYVRTGNDRDNSEDMLSNIQNIERSGGTFHHVASK